MSPTINRQRLVGLPLCAVPCPTMVKVRKHWHFPQFCWRWPHQRCRRQFTHSTSVSNKHPLFGRRPLWPQVDFSFHRHPCPMNDRCFDSELDKTNLSPLSKQQPWQPPRPFAHERQRAQNVKPWKCAPATAVIGHSFWATLKVSLRSKVNMSEADAAKRERHSLCLCVA